MAYVLGIDGGNSKTLALLADESGRVLGAGRAGGSNHQGGHLDRAMESIRAAAYGAMRSAGVASSDIETAVLALAGADFPEDFALLEPAVAELSLARRFSIENDAIAAMRSGTDNPDAVVVVLGAGTNAAGRNAHGRQERFPAVGWISGDWGAADDLAREAVRLTVRSQDGRGMPGPLSEMVLETLGLPDADTLVKQLYHGRITADRLRSLAPLVFRAAEEGDEFAADLARRQGVEAAAMANAIMARLDLLDKRPDIVLAGGLFRVGSQLLLDEVTDGISQAAPDAQLVMPDLEPAAGAVLLALDLLQAPTDAHTRATLAETSASAISRAFAP